MKITSAFGIRLSGTMDKSFTIFSRNGKLYMRAYAAPKNPRSEQQTRQRERFKTAVAAWKALPRRQKDFYDRVAHEMTGYNLFVGRYVKALRSGLEPELPVAIRWTVLRPAIPDDGWLAVRNWRVQIFKDDLRNRNGEIPLTPSDRPYRIVLSGAGQRDVELEINRLLDAPMPILLENEKLSLKLFRDPPVKATEGAVRAP